MLTRNMRLMAAALLALGAMTGAAEADSCSGHSHATGTILGAAGGGLIGGLASHGNIGWTLGGAAVGGLAGNAIARDRDCHHHYYRHAHYWRHRHHYYSSREPLRYPD